MRRTVQKISYEVFWLTKNTSANSKLIEFKMLPIWLFTLVNLQTSPARAAALKVCADTSICCFLIRGPNILHPKITCLCRV